MSLTKFAKRKKRTYTVKQVDQSSYGLFTAKDWNDIANRKTKWKKKYVLVHFNRKTNRMSPVKTFNTEKEAEIYMKPKGILMKKKGYR